MILGRRSRLHFKKKIPKAINIRANLIIGSAKKLPPLASTLGSLGINAIEFYNLFNKQSVEMFPTMRILLSPYR